MPAPQKTSTWNSHLHPRLPRHCSRAAAAGVSRGHHGFGKDWIGGTWGPTSVGSSRLETVILKPQGMAVEATVGGAPTRPTFPRCILLVVLCPDP